MSEIKLESPLVGQADALHGGKSHVGPGVTLRERPFLGHISVRGKDDDEAFADACKRILGVALPTTPNTQVRGDGVVLCWLRPTEWLVLTEGDNSEQVMQALRAALEGVHSGVIDLSSGQTLIEVHGECAVETLSKGTTFDLHPRSFGAAQCARTLLAKSTAFIRVVEPGETFQVVVRRSFADYLWQWLRDAAGEYDPVIEPPEATLAAASS